MAASLLCIEILLRHPSPGGDELVEAMLWELEPPGVERQDAATFSALVEDPRPLPAGSIRWRVYLEDAPDAAADPYRHALGGVAEVATWRLDDLSFLTRWREFFKPTRVSDRIIVHPPWDVPCDADAVLVEIEPGMAFGTGTHETTRLCLAAVDRALASGARTALDVGCGSGVLGIAAAKLGARHVVAIDNDPDAVAIATENAAQNGVDVAVSGAAVSGALGAFDLVVANILPQVLIALSDALIARTAPGGRLVLSGILADQVERVCDHFVRGGLDHARTDQQREWTSIEFDRPRGDGQTG